MALGLRTPPLEQPCAETGSGQWKRQKVSPLSPEDANRTGNSPFAFTTLKITLNMRSE